MKREELKNLGISEEAIDKVMALNGQDIEKQKQSTAAEKARADELAEQLTQRDADLKELEKRAGDSDTLKGQVAELQEKYQKETAALQEKFQRSAYDKGLELELVKAKARDTAAVRAMLDLSKIEQGEDGVFTGLKEQLESLSKEKAWAFEGQGKAAYTPKAGETAVGVPNIAAAIRSHYETPQG